MIPSQITVHIPVMVPEVKELGRPALGEIWVDGTAGGGGHSRTILQAIGSQGMLIAVDRAPNAVGRLKSVLSSPCASIHCSSYENIPEILTGLGIPKVHGILLDLGLSSDQLSDASRGFSFSSDGPLDMRFDHESGQPVWEWLHSADEKDIADVIFRFGEERFSRRIARKIVQNRQTAPIKSAQQLREVIYSAVPHSPKSSRLDPATRTFQALRIFINDELDVLSRALQRLPDCLLEAGRLLVISFHSLEDRIVKHSFRNDGRLEILTSKPAVAQETEVFENPRCRSAKMRVAIRKSVKSPSSKNKYSAFSKVSTQD